MADEEFRLPPEVRPTHYRIHITPDLVAGTFAGEVAIDLELARARDHIELHALDLTIHTVSIRQRRSTLVGIAEPRPTRETMDLRFTGKIGPGKAQLELRFTGVLQKSLRGFYAAQSEGQRYAFTQLEAADARRFFPCFDEPSFKARYTFAVTTDASHAVVSNNPVERVEEHGADRKTVYFTTTPKLSTYLCALGVGDLQCSEARYVGETPIRVWHVPGKGHLTDFALEAAVESLSRLEQYFGLPYPYDKLDLVAVPDFEAGAMENAGAVFFRETLLLVDPATVTLGEKKRVAEVVAHELAHMWYGDLVTMSWWNDLWLNEAFATWMAFRVVDEWKPEWRMWNNFEHHRAVALSLDALTNTHPIYAEVANPAQATENFDAITYEKGASVVRMVEHYLGPQKFRAGVRKYIRRHREANAEAADLWRALEEASKQKVNKVVRVWIEHPGFPLLSLARTEKDGRSDLELRQERFVANPKMKAKRQQWPIPLVVKVGGRREPRTLRHLMTKARERLPLGDSRDAAWCYGNAAEGGFYRPLHDEANLAALVAVLPTALSAVERMGLVGHQWALVRAGKAPITSFLDLVNGLGSEEDHDVLDALAGPLRFIEDQIIADDDAALRKRSQRWLSRIFRDNWNAVGWDTSRSESDDVRLRRSSLLRILGDIAEDSAIAAEARARFERYLRDRGTLEPNLADSLVSIVARSGDASLYDTLLATVAAARTPQERRRFQMSLADFQSAKLVQRTLELVLSEEIATQDVGILLVRLFGNRGARSRTWEFIKKRWEAVSKRLPPMMVSRVIDATPSLKDPAYKRDLVSFFRSHPVPTAKRALQQAQERFDLNHQLRRRVGKDLARWLA